MSSSNQQIDVKSPANSNRAKEKENQDNQDKQKVLNKKLDMIFQQVKILYALQYTKTDKYPNQIIPNLYLGSVGAALSKDVLVELNIKYVLTAMEEFKHPFQDIITEYKIIRIKDSKNENIINYFEESNEFMHKAISSNQNVLVHCFAGVSRSTSLVLAYLMKYQNKTLDEALNITKQARPVIQPNQNFLAQLKKYEELLKKENTEQQPEDQKEKDQNVNENQQQQQNDLVEQQVEENKQETEQENKQN
ncbi:tyrosine phosphatase (macronuclear) [Tetrahymena thermophila SB210]|uniref:Tyrosine phosphatase n=1 Tax=Tetrahymena thermophila (strain SB210) TaxID=312017 RepID=Q240W9_TETTS|nr:tyrosine phosphatase [Tetrahymena thermophila SB210]EAS02295.1 tyrosine phosphatase [Tetrahymena thermophila SB210]|eukprot:XP_001022540.1 tyrosine phosphatase [Tetrahymena thermophila SB210]